METALGALVLALFAALTALLEHIRRKLSENTELTQQTKAAANGQLTGTLSQLAAERNKVFALRVLLREREDRIAYITARLPEAEKVLVGYQERRSTKSTAEEEAHVLSRFLDEDLDDPTGTDAGAHPNG